MGKVNVVKADGTVVAVDEDLARQAGTGPYAHPESVSEEEQRLAADKAKEEGGGALGAVMSNVGGALDTLSFGGYGKAVNAAFPGRDTPIYGENNASPYETTAQAHPLARTIGGLEAFVVPGAELGAPGLAARAGEAVTSARWGQRAVEGAILGAGAHVAETNASGDQLSIEGVLESAGLGGMINVGFGVLSDGLTNSGWRAKKAIAEAEVARTDSEFVKKGDKLFSADSPSYNEFRESFEASQYAYRDANRQIRAVNQKYEDFVGSNSKLTNAVKSAESVINEVAGRYETNVGEATLLQSAKPRVIGKTAEGEPVLAAPKAVAPLTSSPGEFPKLAGVTAEGVPLVSVSRPPISEDLANRLGEYRDRISRIYKLKGGGWDVDKSGKWVKAPGTPAQPAKALEELRSLTTDLEQAFPKASGRLKELPAVPATPIPYVEANLAKDLRGFSRMTPEKIAEVANGLDEVTASSLNKVAADIGVDAAATPAETLAALHGKLREYTLAADRLEAAATTAGRAPKVGGPLGWMKSAAANGVANVAGFLGYGAVGGGLMGIGAGAAIRSGTRGAMRAAEDSVLGTSLVTAKDSLRQKVTNLIAKYAEPTGAALNSLGPVTAYLAQTFPDGRPDPEKDIRKLAANRIREIAGVQASAPDAMYALVEPLLGHPSDAGWKIHNIVTFGLQQLVDQMPKDPGISNKLGQSDWAPTHSDSIALAHRLEALQAPLNALARSLAGAGHPAATAMLSAVMPGMMAEAASQAMARQAMSTAPVSYKTANNFSSAFGVPATGFAQGAVITALQGQYLPKPSAPQPKQRNGSTAVGGRPPAINNPVAGSSVGGLLSTQ